MSPTRDGAVSPYFSTLPFTGNISFDLLKDGVLSSEMIAVIDQAPRGSCVFWGIPFEIGEPLILIDKPVSIDITPILTHWLIFCHTSDHRPQPADPGGIISPMRGAGMLGEYAANYVIRFSDGSEVRAAIRRRRQIGDFRTIWGEWCFEAVVHHKPYPVRASHEQTSPDWGWSQTRVNPGDEGDWLNWLWAWENPYPEKTITAFHFEPVSGVVLISAISCGEVETLPLRWQPRRKALLRLPKGKPFQPDLDQDGQLKQIQLDLGQVISAFPRRIYPNDAWKETYNNQLPSLSTSEILVEYTAHPQACFHLNTGMGSRRLELIELGRGNPIELASPEEVLVKLRVVESDSGKVVPVKLHVHGEWGEYLAPLDRHRILNPSWFEDYSADFVHIGGRAEPDLQHFTTYISGETRLRLPLGKVFIEVSKGFEIRPVHKIVEVTAGTREIVVEIEKALHWREKGWVTADTHVHFLSPITAMLEGSAEGVNVINLLASQWGELMTNVGDFDGKNTWGSKEAGGEGEYLVRVGTENRQHVLGHISLLGYNGAIIAPMTTGGADESALGDPIEILLIEWARECRAKGGVVVLPHFPNPRLEHAAALISGEIDAIEMTSWQNHYSGISPYSLSDWYRYLNCGYLVPAVGGTDKMAASTAVGTVRTYAHLDPLNELDYENWKKAIRSGETFVTYGPLLEFTVEGYDMGSKIQLPRDGGTVDVLWQAASVTVPMTRVELVVNGEIRESLAIPPDQASGQWSIRLERSSWLALLVRGHQPGKPEIIAAHSTPVMVMVEGSPLLAAADAVTILDQIEGALIYLDTVGTRAEDRASKRMRLALISAHRQLHNRIHQDGQYHEHPVLI